MIKVPVGIGAKKSHRVKRKVEKSHKSYCITVLKAMQGYRKSINIKSICTVYSIFRQRGQD